MTTAELLECHVEAAGGEEALEDIRTRVLRAVVVTDLPTWSPPVLEVDTVAVRWRAPDMFAIEHRTATGRAVHAFDGTVEWRTDEDGVSTSGDQLRPRDPRSAWLYDAHLALRMREHFPELAVIGTSQMPEGKCLVASIDGRHEHRLYFDAETCLITRLGYNRELRDYRDVDGVMIPHEVSYSRKGGSTTYHVLSVVHNVPLDESIFTRPAGTEGR